MGSIRLGGCDAAAVDVPSHATVTDDNRLQGSVRASYARSRTVVVVILGVLRLRVVAEVSAGVIVVAVRVVPSANVTEAGCSAVEASAVTTRAATIGNAVPLRCARLPPSRDGRQPAHPGRVTGK